MSIVSIVFGIIGMRMGLGSIHGFIKRSGEKMFWWFGHMQGMIASYIAAMTAFSAVKLTHWFGAAWWVWLWPTIVGAPAIAIRLHLSMHNSIQDRSRQLHAVANH